ncbi:MAG: DUF4912 domain-containing protein [bacterium]|nr:DUF4912 domain-containing protein [bacterium]
MQVAKRHHFILTTGEVLPLSYNENKLTLLPKDPEIVFLFWDYSETTLSKIFLNNFLVTIRIFNDCNKNLDKTNYRFIYPGNIARDWYFNLKDTSFTMHNLSAELGYSDQDEHFFMLAKAHCGKIFGKLKEKIDSLSSNQFLS